jgi:hypothetical protein
MGDKAKPLSVGGAGGFAVSAQESRLRMTAPALCSAGRAGGWIETPRCQFDNQAGAVGEERKARPCLGDVGKAVG